MDEFAEKSVKLLEEPEREGKHHRSVSKSPFDDLLETSLMSYEKDSMVASRTNKDINCKFLKRIV